eukprot:2368072-Rhodomonas_salina.7
MHLRNRFRLLRSASKPATLDAAVVKVPSLLRRSSHPNTLCLSCLSQTRRAWPPRVRWAARLRARQRHAWSRAERVLRSRRLNHLESARRATASTRTHSSHPAQHPPSSARRALSCACVSSSTAVRRVISRAQPHRAVLDTDVRRRASSRATPRATPRVRNQGSTNKRSKALASRRRSARRLRARLRWWERPKRAAAWSACTNKAHARCRAAVSAHATCAACRLDVATRISHCSRSIWLCSCHARRLSETRARARFKCRGRRSITKPVN